jgi:hypothetical protein
MLPTPERGWEPTVLEDATAARVRELAADSDMLEAEVRSAILCKLLAESQEAVGAKEILDLAEAFAWITNPGQPHAGSAR